jgi:hypothetical protein
VIPAYNESDHLDRVVAFVRQQVRKGSLTGRYGDDRATSFPASRAAIEPGGCEEQIASHIGTPLL